MATDAEIERAELWVRENLPREAVGPDWSISEKAAGAFLACSADKPISERTMRSWRTEGRSPPFTNVKRTTRYRIPDLLDWMASRVVE